MRRYLHNPILSPIREHSWEAYAVFNPSVIKRGEHYYMLYRALSSSDLLKKQGSSYSSVGVAKSRDGIHFYDRKILISPEEEWELFGCEDPRATCIEGKCYIFYTAISTLPPRAEGIRVGVAISRDLERIEEKYMVTSFNAKAMALFPERINGKLMAILTVHTDRPPAYIAVAPLGDDPSKWRNEMDEWYNNFMAYTLSPDPRRSPLDHIEVGAPPVRLKQGWLLIYSYIQNYFSPKPEDRVFGVEALLLDLKDPRRVLRRTRYPLMVPEEFYERYGNVPNVVFPTSALKQRDGLRIYYGAADTTCCLATVKIRDILMAMDGMQEIFERCPWNPIIKPNTSHEWESLATFNPAAIELEGKIYILYRALSRDKTSTIGLAVSEDGFNIVERLEEPIYVPRESFEMKLTPGHSGCEDPRIIRLNDKLYMFYTAYDNVHPPKVAVTSITVDDFLSRNWNAWSRPRIISPPGIDDKDACIIPERIDGKLFFIHRALGVNIGYDYIESLEEVKSEELLSLTLLPPRPGMWDGKKVGLAAPPIKIRKGWLVFYHGVSHDNVYRVGAFLLDLKRPEKLIGRTLFPLLEPLEAYEREGYVRNVVFPCGAIMRDDTIYLYYGGADTYVCAAKAPLDEILARIT
ncbi:MAG: hypothetical protein QW325_04300 [Nitrososphaerota archaeon]